MTWVSDYESGHEGFEESLRNRLLIASPTIGDRRFDRSIIYMCVHTPESAMGIIVNKPMGALRLPDLLEQLGIEEHERAPDSHVLNGGPVDRDRGFVLHSDDYASEDATLAIASGIGLTATKDVLEAMTTDQAPRRAVLALGYASWGPGQLETEIMENAWLVGHADEELLFSGDLDEKWSRALTAIGVPPDKLSTLHGSA